MDYAQHSGRENVHSRALAAQLHAANIRLAESSRETLRARMVAALVHSVYSLGAGSAIADDLAPEFLKVVLEKSLCDVGVLLQSGPERGEFTTVRAIGHVLQSQSELLVLPGAPLFLALPGGSCAAHVETELRRAYGTGPILWSLHRKSGLALLLSSRSNATIRQNFEVGDRELVETALELYVDNLSRRRVNRTLVQMRQAASAQALACKQVVMDLSNLLLPMLGEMIDVTRRLEEGNEGNFPTHVLPALGIVGTLAVQCRELVKVAAEVSAFETVPLKTEFTCVSLANLVSRAAKSIEDRAQLKGIQTEVVLQDLAMTAYLDPGWMTEILGSVLSEVVAEAEWGSKVVMELSRRSEGSISIAVKWASGYQTGSSEAREAEHSVRPQVLSGLTPDIARLVDAYGGTFIRESIEPGVEQLVLTLSAEN